MLPSRFGNVYPLGFPKFLYTFPSELSLPVFISYKPDAPPYLSVGSNGNHAYLSTYSLLSNAGITFFMNSAISLSASGLLVFHFP